jgi:hypothetical protein
MSATGKFSIENRDNNILAMPDMYKQDNKRTTIDLINNSIITNTRVDSD